MEIKIKVLGSGCPTCKKLHELTQEVVKELGFEINVEYISDISEIITMGIMSSPVLVINNKPVLVGILPNKKELKEIIEESIKDGFGSKDFKCNENCNCDENCECNNTDSEKSNQYDCDDIF